MLDAARRVDAMEEGLGRAPQREELTQWAVTAAFVPEFVRAKGRKPYLVRTDVSPPRKSGQSRAAHGA
jgi:hypothetical protein